MNAMSTLVHHGMIFIPLGYSVAFPQLTNMDEVRGGKRIFHFCLFLFALI